MENSNFKGCDRGGLSFTCVKDRERKRERERECENRIKKIIGWPPIIYAYDYIYRYILLEIEGKKRGKI